MTKNGQNIRGNVYKIIPKIIKSDHDNITQWSLIESKNNRVLAIANSLEEIMSYYKNDLDHVVSVNILLVSEDGQINKMIISCVGEDATITFKEYPLANPTATNKTNLIIDRHYLYKNKNKDWVLSKGFFSGRPLYLGSDKNTALETYRAKLEQQFVNANFFADISILFVFGQHHELKYALFCVVENRRLNFVTSNITELFEITQGHQYYITFVDKEIRGEEVRTWGLSKADNRKFIFEDRERDKVESYFKYEHKIKLGVSSVAFVHGNEDIFEKSILIYSEDKDIRNFDERVVSLPESNSIQTLMRSSRNSKNSLAYSSYVLLCLGLIFIVFTIGTLFSGWYRGFDIISVKQDENSVFEFSSFILFLAISGFLLLSGFILRWINRPKNLRVLGKKKIKIHKES